MRNRPLIVVTAPAVGLVATALLAAPMGVPWWVPALFAVVVGVELLVVSREHYTDMEPLIGTSTAIRRQLPWWRPAVVGVPAVVVGILAMSLPLPGAFDLRQFVTTNVVAVADENPLATAARLRRDPPASAEGIDVTVDVDGATPGRLRTAVLDRYESEGWRQRAEFAITGEALEPDPVDIAPASACTGLRPGRRHLRRGPRAGSASPHGVRSSRRPFLTPTQTASCTGPSPADVSPVGPGSVPAGVALYRCPDSTIIDGTADALAGGGSPLDRLRRIEVWLKLTKIYDTQAPGGQTVRSVELFLTQEFARGNLEVFVTAHALLARCADVPVRVVVGYPAPAADGSTEYTPTEISAWVETPLAGVGWVPLDPVPTPAEQQRQAELARQPERPRPSHRRPTHHRPQWNRRASSRPCGGRWPSRSSGSASPPSSPARVGHGRAAAHVVTAQSARRPGGGRALRLADGRRTARRRGHHDRGPPHRPRDRSSDGGPRPAAGDPADDRAHEHRRSRPLRRRQHH